MAWCRNDGKKPSYVEIAPERYQYEERKSRAKMPRQVLAVMRSDPVNSSITEDSVNHQQTLQQVQLQYKRHVRSSCLSWPQQCESCPKGLTRRESSKTCGGDQGHSTCAGHVRRSVLTLMHAPAG